MSLLAPGIRNSHLDALNTDYLYHLGLDTSMDLKAMFGDVQYVCMGGSSVRAEKFATKAAEDLGVEIPEGGLRRSARLNVFLSTK